MKVLRKISQSLLHIVITGAVIAGLFGSIRSAAVPAPPSTFQSTTLTIGDSLGGIDKNTAQKDFTVTLEAGIDDYVRSKYPFTANVSITNQKEDFTGTVRLIPAKSYYSETNAAYGQDIILSKGEQKSYKIDLPAQASGATSILLQITDKKNKVVFTQKMNLPYFGGGDFYVMGILSDDFSALNYFDGCDVILDQYALKVKVLELDEENLPENGEALKICQMILISDYDTARLSDRQYQALKEWVISGGVLMIGTGAGYQNVFNKFNDGFISGTIGNLSKSTLTLGEEALTGVDVLDYQFAEAVPLYDAGSGGKSLEYVKQTGLGQVVVLGYNPGMEPLYSWSERAGLAQMLISESIGSQTQNWLSDVGNASYYWMDDLGGLPSLVDNPRKPSTFLYGLLFVTYAIVVGPILYLILKARKKREKLWVVICVVALAFTALVYITGFAYRVRNPIINSFAIIRLSDSMKEEDVKSEIIIPVSKPYQISLDAEYQSFTPSTGAYNYSYYDENELKGEYQYTVKKDNNHLVLDIEKMPAFQEILFTVKNIAENDIGTLDLDVSFYPTGMFAGTITNNTNVDLREVTLSFANNFYFAGDMPKGQSHTILEDNIEFASGYYGYAGSRYSTYSSGLSDEELRENHIFSQIMNYMWSYYGAKETGNYCAVWGLMENYDVSIAGQIKAEQNSGALAVQQYTVDFENATGAYLEDINALLLGDATALWDDYGYGPATMINDYTTATYYFGDLTIDTLWIDREDSHGYDYADVLAYNHDTGEFDPIFVGYDELKKEELWKYLQDGSLVLQYCYPDGIEYAYIPRISAWWEGE